MKTKWIRFALLVPLVATFSLGSVYKGQKTYMKSCRKCHGSGGRMTALHTQDEWESLLENNGAALLKKHEGFPKALKKLHSKRFQKNIKHIKEFFLRYASDSGNVPACN